MHRHEPWCDFRLFLRLCGALSIRIMAATGSAPRTIALDPPSGKGSVATQALLSAMLRADDQISQLIFSPGRPPQIEVSGQLVAVLAPGLEVLSADDTRRFASDLIGQNKRAITMLQEQGSCDISFGLPGLARFRVNVFLQRGSCAVVMRVMPSRIPDFAWLGLSATVHNWGDFWRAMFMPLAQGTIRPWSERAFFMGFYSLFGLDALPFRIFVFLTQIANLTLIRAVGERLTGSPAAGFWAAMLWISNTAMIPVMTWSSVYNQALCGFFLVIELAFCGDN